MEVNNRFDLLASLPVEEKTNEFLLTPKAELNNQHSTRNFWEVPEYVEKPPPSSSTLKKNVEKSLPVTKVKKTLSVKKIQPSVDTTKSEEEINETSSTIEIQNQSSTQTYYPPQPYKFKPAAANHRNEIKPKFNRKINVIPKHNSARGNSKACANQI